MTIGVDPGFAQGAVGVVQDRRAVYSKMFRTSPGAHDRDRFDSIIAELLIPVRMFEGRIRAIACEAITGARQGGFKSKQTSDKAEHIRRVVGNVHAIAVLTGVPFEEVLPFDWRAVVGVRGASSNERDKRAVRAVTGWTAKVFSGHAAAALGVAVAGERAVKSAQFSLGFEGQQRRKHG